MYNRRGSVVDLANCERCGVVEAQSVKSSKMKVYTWRLASCGVVGLWKLKNKNKILRSKSRIGVLASCGSCGIVEAQN